MIEEIANFGENVSVVRFRASRRLPRYRPGQFLHLALDECDPSSGFWPDSRVFSIASSPSERELVIAYSAIGNFTRRMRRELEVGRSIWLKLPFGSFMVDKAAEAPAPVILVAGGTGITAFTAFLEAEARLLSARPIRLFYGVRNAELLLFGSELRRIGANCGQFSYSAYCEAIDGSHDATLIPGRISPDDVVEAYLKGNGAHIFLAGPPPMLSAFRTHFEAAGVAADRIHIDEWE